MANLRDLKKDVDMLMSMALEDCFNILEHNPDADSEALMKIAAGIVEKHRELRKMIKHPGSKLPRKQVKAYFDNLAAEALSAADQAFEALSGEVKKIA